MTRPDPVRQRATLVLPSSGAFDSRAWRIASALTARGHDVTVVARSEPGLADREDHPAGYRILRVPVSAEAGLLGPLRRVARRVRRAGAAHPTADASAKPASAAEATPRRGGLGARARTAFAAAWRLAAIALTVRSQRLAGATHARNIVLDAAADLDLGAGVRMAGGLGQHMVELAVGIVGEEAGRGIGRDAGRGAAADQVADPHAEAAGDGVP